MIQNLDLRDKLQPYWNALNNFLSIPIVQFFGYVLLVWLVLLLKSVRGWASGLWSRAWRWTKESFLMPILYPSLGLATTKDLSDLQRQLLSTAKEEKGAIKEGKASLAGRNIERLVFKWTLGENISQYLLKMQPNNIGADEINNILHGPFCPDCHRNLLFSVREDFGDLRRKIRTECTGCDWSLNKERKGSSPVNADPVKRHVYEGLDAEFRRTGQIADKNEE